MHVPCQPVVSYCFAPSRSTHLQTKRLTVRSVSVTAIQPWPCTHAGRRRLDQKQLSTLPVQHLSSMHTSAFGRVYFSQIYLISTLNIRHFTLTFMLWATSETSHPNTTAMPLNTTTHCCFPSLFYERTFVTRFSWNFSMPPPFSLLAEKLHAERIHGQIMTKTDMGHTVQLNVSAAKCNITSSQVKWSNAPTRFHHLHCGVIAHWPNLLTIARHAANHHAVTWLRCRMKVQNLLDVPGQQQMHVFDGYDWEESSLCPQLQVINT